MRTETTRTDIRDAILDAAERLLGLYGYSKTTVDDIAREAGIGKGTIYLHFRSKEEIAVSWIDRLNHLVRSTLSEIALREAPPADKLREMLIARVMARFDSARNHEKSLDDLLAALRPIIHASRKRWHEAEAEIFAQVIDEGIGLEVFRNEDSADTAHMLVLATNSLLPYNLCPKQLGEREEIAGIADRLSRLLVSGVLVR